MPRGESNGATPRRNLSPSSDVPHQKRAPPNRRATTQLACVERCSRQDVAVGRCPRRVAPPADGHGNIAPPGRAGRWRVISQGQRSGCEHGSTVASTVVALDAGLPTRRTTRFNRRRPKRLDFRTDRIRGSGAIAWFCDYRFAVNLHTRLPKTDSFQSSSAIQVPFRWQQESSACCEIDTG